MGIATLSRGIKAAARALLLALAFPAVALAQSVPVPSSSSFIAIPPAITASGTSDVIKTSADNLYSVYATNLTATAGFLILYNSATVPGTGSLTAALVLDCIPLQASSVASINYAPYPPKWFSNGIVALISSASVCTTYTTGTVTAFISGSAP